MKRSRSNNAKELSPSTNKKKLKQSPTKTTTTNNINKNITPCSNKTSGGISKSLLTPCRRLGLTKNKGKPLKIFSNDKIVNTTKDGKTDENKNDFDDNTTNHCEKNISNKRSLRKTSNMKSSDLKNEVKNSLESIPKPVEIFVRETFSQESSASSEFDRTIENIDTTNIINTKNKKSQRIPSKTKTEQLEIKNATDGEIANKLPKVILQKIKSPEVDNEWKISPAAEDGNITSKNSDKFKEINSEKDDKSKCREKSNEENGEKHKKSKSVESIKSNTNNKSKLATKCKESSNNNDKEPVVAELKKRSLTSQECNDFENKESKRNCVSLGNTPKKCNKKDEDKIKKDENRIKKDENKVKVEVHKSMEATDVSCNKKKSDGELLKSNSKDKSQIDTKKSKSDSNVIEVSKTKSESSGIVSVASSQSSMYSYQSDDDFEEKTIVDKKTYDKKVKKSKLQMNRTSSDKRITQKDINEIQQRINAKEDKLIMIQQSPRKGLNEQELEDLIVAWRGGCQKALEELLEISKSKGMQSNANMEDLLRALHIPHDLVKYDPDEMIFEE